MDFEGINEATFRHLSNDEKRGIIIRQSAGSYLSDIGIITPHISHIRDEFDSQVITSEHPVFVMERIGNSLAFNTKFIGGLPGVDSATNYPLVNQAHRSARNALLPLLYSNGRCGAITAFFPHEYGNRSVGIVYGETRSKSDYTASRLKARLLGIDLGREEIGSMFVLMTKEYVVIVGGGMHLQLTRSDIAGYDEAISNAEFKEFLDRKYMKIPSAVQLAEGIERYIPIL